MAPLQKRALFSLIVGLALTAAVVIVLVLQGDITAFDRDTSIRTVMYIAVIGVPLAYLILVNVSLRKPTQIDERDRRIIEKSREIQCFAIILSLAAWTIGLTEVYRNQEQIPVALLSLIFMSILIISSLAQSLGILAGYRGANRNV